MYVFHNVLRYDPGCILLLLSVSGNRVEWSCRLELFIRAAWCSLGTPFKLLWTETGAQATLQECMNTEWEREKSKSGKKREKEIENSNLEPWLTYKMPGTFKSALLKDTFYLWPQFQGLHQAVHDKEMSGQFKWTNKANTAWQSSTVMYWCFHSAPPSPASKSVS